MCFSAGVSFTASATLSIIGLLAMRQAQTTGNRMLAGAPLIFAIQQAAEGFLWLSLTRASYAFLQTPMTYLFLFCAFCWWPSWIPHTLYVMEDKNSAMKKMLYNIMIFGYVVAGYLGYCVLMYGALAYDLNHHIAYDIFIPGNFYPLIGLFYVIPTIVPFYLSSIPNMKLMGSCIAVAYATTYFLYDSAFISIWCFFAALISAIALDSIHRINK